MRWPCAPSRLTCWRLPLGPLPAAAGNTRACTAHLPRPAVTATPHPPTAHAYLCKRRHATLRWRGTRSALPPARQHLRCCSYRYCDGCRMPTPPASCATATNRCRQRAYHTPHRSLPLCRRVLNAFPPHIRAAASAAGAFSALPLLPLCFERDCPPRAGSRHGVSGTGWFRDKCYLDLGKATPTAFTPVWTLHTTATLTRTRLLANVDATRFTYTPPRTDLGVTASTPHPHHHHIRARTLTHLHYCWATAVNAGGDAAVIRAAVTCGLTSRKTPPLGAVDSAEPPCHLVERTNYARNAVDLLHCTGRAGRAKKKIR